MKTPAEEDEADPPEAFEWTPPGHPDHPDTTVGKDGSAADAEKDNDQPKTEGTAE